MGQRPRRLFCDPPKWAPKRASMSQSRVLRHFQSPKDFLFTRDANGCAHCAAALTPPSAKTTTNNREASPSWSFCQSFFRLLLPNQAFVSRNSTNNNPQQLIIRYHSSIVRTMSKPFDYSKWDKIELSDDEDDVHPNIDKESWFRMKHRSRVEREENEEKDKAKIRQEVWKWLFLCVCVIFLECIADVLHLLFRYHFLLFRLKKQPAASRRWSMI